MTPQLQLTQIVKQYPGCLANDHVDLTVMPGEIHALLGENGAGKSTLVKIIYGVVKPDAGEIRWDGAPVKIGNPNDARARGIGMVFQQGALFPHLSVLDNVLYGLEGGRGATDTAMDALEQVGMAACSRRFPDQLSGGEQQRVALARALAPAPRVILLDEPFASLDASLRQRLREEIPAVLRASGTTAVLVTHDQEEALTLSDRVGILNEGRLIQEGPPHEIYERPETAFTARFLGDANLFAGTARSGGIELADGTRIERAFTYEWRLWSAPEIRELLLEAGFSKATVYWEGEDEDGEGNGEFLPDEKGEADLAWIAYIVAEK